jgi:hypothetical protein
MALSKKLTFHVLKCFNFGRLCFVHVCIDYASKSTKWKYIYFKLMLKLVRNNIIWYLAIQIDVLEGDMIETI